MSPRIRAIHQLALGLVVLNQADSGGGAEAKAEVVIFRGMSDASTAVPLEGREFLVADDETNQLRRYDARSPSTPLETIAFSSMAGLAPDDDEADFEGSSRIGNRIYWISSHGRDKDGDWEPTRHRFVGVELTGESDQPLKGIGRPYTKLATALAKDARLQALGVDRKIQVEDDEDEDLAPKDEGLNIEGMAPMKEGNGLWLGLRNPRPEVDGTDLALLIALLNPEAILTEGAEAEIGDPLFWDLDELGIRAMAYDEQNSIYWIVAGPHDSDGAPFHLYRWSGERDEAPELVIKNLEERADHFTPEAILTWPDEPRLLLLSDDGTVEVEAERDAVEEGEWDDGKAEQKRLLNLNDRTFKGVWVEP